MVEIKGVGGKLEILLPFYQVIVCFLPSKNQGLETYQYKCMFVTTVVEYTISGTVESRLLRYIIFWDMI